MCAKIFLMAISGGLFFHVDVNPDKIAGFEP
jgi:hypothetical protein